MEKFKIIHPMFRIAQLNRILENAKGDSPLFGAKIMEKIVQKINNV